MALDSTPAMGSQTKSLQSALDLLRSLKSRIMNILGNHRLRVSLDRMDVMKPGHGRPGDAHVLWLGPSLENDDGRRLKAVCGDNISLSVPRSLAENVLYKFRLGARHV